MDRLTLDTNVIEDWAWAEERSDDIRFRNDKTKKDELLSLFIQLRKHNASGGCEFGVTTQIYTDLELSVGELPEYIEDMLGDYVDLSGPGISTFPMIFPFVFADEEKIQEILETVFPGAPSLKNASKRQRKDALQLYAHSVANNDYFLTSDKAILRAADKLKNQFGICVVSLREYVISIAE